MQIDGTEHYFVVGLQQTTAHAVGDTARLLKDFLEHIVGISSFFQFVEVNIHILNFESHRGLGVGQILDVHLLTSADYGHFLIV